MAIAIKNSSEVSNVMAFPRRRRQPWRADEHHDLERPEAGEALTLTTVTFRSAARKDESASWETPSSVITSSISEISESVQKPGAANFELSTSRMVLRADEIIARLSDATSSDVSVSNVPVTAEAPVMQRSACSVLMKLSPGSPARCR